MTRPLLKEFGWLLIALIITVLMATIFFRSDITLEWDSNWFVINRLVIADSLFWPAFFVAICFLLFLIKEIRNRFSKTFPAIIILVSGILLIALLAILAKFFPVFGGYTMYPPLSALTNNEKGVEIGWDESADQILNLIIAIQVIIAIVCVYVAYRLGISKIKNS